MEQIFGLFTIFYRIKNVHNILYIESHSIKKFIILKNNIKLMISNNTDTIIVLKEKLLLVGLLSVLL